MINELQTQICYPKALVTVFSVIHVEEYERLEKTFNILRDGHTA